MMAHITGLEFTEAGTSSDGSPCMVLRGYCSECRAEILNSAPGTEHWQCDHGPYGTLRRPRTDREVLDIILSRVRKIERFLGDGSVG